MERPAAKRETGGGVGNKLGGAVGAGSATGGMVGGAASGGSGAGGTTGKIAGGNAPRGGRRGFLVRLMAVLIGGLITLFPFAAGLFVFVDPWRRAAGGVHRVRVATLDDVPDDGVPRRFQVSENQIDAWNYYPNQPVGAVYLLRTKGQGVPLALQATCPHAGCMVDYSGSAHAFKCPCHNSSFDVNGRIIQPSPAPRPMDTLVCSVVSRGDTQEVWVEFQNFYTGTAEKIAKI